jgi:hypothetical protein
VAPVPASNVTCINTLDVAGGRFVGSGLNNQG